MKWDAPLNQYPLECGANYGGCKMIKDRNIAWDAAINPMKILGAGMEPNYGGDTFYVCKASLTNTYNYLSGKVPGDRIFTSIAEADAAMTDNVNDRCLIMAGHTESSAVEIALTTVGAEFIGLGRGPLRPTFTTTGEVNAISLDGNYQTIANIGFAVPGIDTVPADIDVVGAGCQILNTYHLGSTSGKNKVDIITLTATANDTLISGLRAYNTTVEQTGGIINIEGACSRIEIANCFNFDSIGMALGAIYDGATALEAYIHDCAFMNAKAGTVVVEFGNNTTGIMMDCFVVGRHTTIMSNITPGSGMNFFNVKGVEEAAKNAISIPADDAE
jgi:hypothetical protein